MFDANMRWLHKDKQFFAEVYSIDGKCILYSEGLRAGEVVKCTMLDETHEKPRVIFHFPNGKDIELAANYDLYECWSVSSGNIDLTGFINGVYKTKDKKLLEKFNDT